MRHDDIITIIRDWFNLGRSTPEQISELLMGLGYTPEASCTLTALALS